MPVTRTRFRVVAFVVLLAMVTYLDRACIATLAPEIMRDLALTKGQMSWIYSAFALAYALFEIPTAWWADRHGTRFVLTRIVGWWSAFTMLTGASTGFVSMAVTRFLFGAGEAGAWPGVARTFSRWIPLAERGRTQGIFFAGAHLAGGVTPLIVVAIAPWLGWRWVFVVFGFFGIIWAGTWYHWFRDDPGEHPGVDQAEAALIAAGRESAHGNQVGWAYWRCLVRNRNTLPLCLMYLPNSFAFYFCITWLPTYLKERHGFDARYIGVFAGLPLILSVAGDLCGGWVTDHITRRFGLRAGRSGVGGVAYLTAAAAMLLAAKINQPVIAASLFSVSLAAAMFVLAPAWSTCLDIGGRHAGVVSAAMNTTGQIGSAICPLLVTYVLNRTGNWDMPLIVMASLFAFGALCWMLIDPQRSIFPTSDGADGELSLS
jgi:MFS transporter, ACS family, glucarate transporter